MDEPENKKQGIVGKAESFAVSSLILIISALCAGVAFFGAWSYAWSGFEWSPFGYETCGMEGLAWIFFILPAFALSLLLKFVLCRKYKYSSAIFVYTLCAGIAVLIFATHKGLVVGYVCAALLAAEFAVNIYAAYARYFRAQKSL